MSFDLFDGFGMSLSIQLLTIGFCLEEVWKDEPDDTTTSQEPSDKAHDRIERAQRVAGVTCCRQGVICQRGEPLICITESLSDASHGRIAMASVE